MGLRMAIVAVVHPMVEVNAPMMTTVLHMHNACEQMQKVLQTDLCVHGSSVTDQQQASGEKQWLQPLLSSCGYNPIKRTSISTSLTPSCINLPRSTCEHSFS